MSAESLLTLLVVEDDIILGNSIADGMSGYGFTCGVAFSGASALEKIQAESFDVIVLDLALEDDSGLGVLRCIRELNEDAHIVLLTPLEYRHERLAGLEAGADDFLLKPFTMSELVARVEASQVRSRSKPKSILETGPLKMDLTTRRVTRDERAISLTPTEFRILEILLRNHNRVVTRRMLCEFLWNPAWEGVTNVIEVHINRLRTKISLAGETRLIHTVRGSGYVLRWQPEDSSAVQSNGDAATSKPISAATTVLGSESATTGEITDSIHQQID